MNKNQPTTNQHEGRRADRVHGADGLATAMFASENPHIVTWQLPSGAWSGDGDFFDLPDRSYGYSGPVSQVQTFPQALVGEGELMPDCGEWAQVDFYKVDTENKQALYDSLIKGGVLGWNGGPADSSIYSGSRRLRLLLRLRWRLRTAVRGAL